MGRLDGKVALISGGARGQGATESRMFSREGAAVVLGDVRGHRVGHDEAARVAAGARRAGGLRRPLMRPDHRRGSCPVRTAMGEITGSGQEPPTKKLIAGLVGATPSCGRSARLPASARLPVR